MARQKKSKNELDAILEQLKRSYGSESSDILEDDLLESPDREEDIELSEILGKIFSSDDTQKGKTEPQDGASSVEIAKTVIDQDIYREFIDEASKGNEKNDPVADSDAESIAVNNPVEEVTADSVFEEERNSEASTEDIIVGEIPVDTAEEKPDESVAVEEFEKFDDQQYVIDEIPENDDITSDSNANEQAVEDVLNIMFANKSWNMTKGEDVILDMAKVEEASEESADYEIYADEAADEVVEAEVNDAIEDIEEAKSPYACDDIESYEDESNDEGFDYVDESDYGLIDDGDEDFAVEDEEYDVVSVDDITDAECDIEDFEDVVEDDVESDIENSIDDEEFVAEESDAIIEGLFVKESESDYLTEAEIKPEIEVVIDPLPSSILILHPEDYTDDPLQESLPKFGIGDHISSAKVKVSNPEVKNAATEDKKAEAFNENDISMLLHFGYGNEIKAKVGEKKAQEVLLEKDSRFTADALERPFGFCGEELTDRSQLAGIKAKYRSNRNICIALLSVVSIISLLITVVNLVFELIPNRIASYPALLTIEFTLVLLTAVIMYRKLISGVTGILKFEMKSSSVFSFVVLLYGICSLASLVMYFITYSSIDPDSLMMFGFCISWYAVLSAASDLLTCIKEYDTFKIIEKSDELYIAERQNAFSPLSRKNRYRVNEDRVYKIRKASLVSGYFRKTSQRDQSSVKPIYLIGVVPIISLVIGGICFFFGKSPIEAISVTALTAMLCLPIAYICMPSIVEYITSRWFSDKKVSFIGSVASEEMAKAELIIVKDNDTVEITSYTEIQPSNRTDIKDSLDIAYELFKKLDGPLAIIGSGASDNQDGANHDIVINQITDHGIDVYFDSSISILLGDKQYMQSHNIKVKTDGTLSTAVRGVDRSVLYMAFDGVPKLGFIVNSRIKPKFLRTVNSLSGEGIRVLVETYEPQINVLYYEQNKGDCPTSIGVIKPERFEDRDSIPMCDGCVICGSDALNLAQAIGISKEIHKQKSLSGIINLALSFCGVAAACLLTALTVTGGNDIAFFEFLSRHMTVLFGLTMFAGLIPCIVEIIRMSRRKK